MEKLLHNSKRRVSTSLLLFLFFASVGTAQTTIGLQNFEASGSTMAYSATGGAVKNGTSGSGDRPATTNFYTSSSNGYWINNGTATITCANVSGLGSYISKTANFSLSSFSVGATNNGADGTDTVIISVSLDGGTTYSDEIEIDGNANAYWAYSATGVASSTYDGDNVTTVFAPAAGGSRTTDGYSNISLNLPDSATQVRIKVTMLNNSNNEGWVVDDVKVLGLTLTNYYSKSTGNLNTLSNWGTNTDGTGTAPSNFTASAQYFNIRNNATPTIGAAWTVSGTGSKVIVGDGTNATNFTVPSGFAFTGNVDVSANATLTLTNATIPTIGTLATTSTVVYNGSTPQSISAESYGNLTYGGTGTNTGIVAGSFDVAGTFTYSGSAPMNFNNTGTARTFNFGSYIMTGTGNVEFGSVTAGTSVVNLTGDFSKTAGYMVTTTSTANVIFNFIGTTQNIQANGGTAIKWINFNIASGSISTINGSFNYDGSTGTTGLFTVSSGGTLNCGTNIISGTANTTFTVAAGGTLGVGSTVGITTTGATGNIQSGTRNYTAGANYVYNGTSAQVTGNGLTVAIPNDLTISNSTGVTLSAATTISGDLLITSGTLSTSGSNFAMSVGGSWTNNGGFTAGTSTETFTGTAQTIGGTSSTTFGAVVIASGATYTMNTSNTASSLTFAAAAVNSSLSQASGTTFTVNGTVTINQPSANTLTSLWNINAGIATVSGLITFAGANTTTSRIGKIVITTGTLNANGGITFVGSAAATKIIDMSGGAGNLNLKGALTIPAASATLVPGTSSTFSYVDTGAQTVNNFNSGNYYNLAVSGSGVKTFGAVTTITNNFSITLPATVTFPNTTNSTANSLTLGSSGQNSGTWGGTGSGATNINTSYFNATTNGRITITTGTCTTGYWLGGTSTAWNTAANWCGSTIPTSSTDVVIPTGTPFAPSITAITAACRNITINSGATLTLSASASSLLNISGDFTNNGTLTAGAASTVTFVGTANQLLGGTSTTSFSNLTINTGTSPITVTNSTAAFAVTGNLTVTKGNLTLQATDASYAVTGDLSVASTGTLTHNVDWATGKQLTVGGNVTVDGVYTKGAAPRSHLQMTGTGKTVRSGTSSFNILTILGTVTANGNLTVDDNFWAPFGSGSFTTGTNTITANSGILVNGGTLTINGGTVNITSGLTIGQSSNGIVTMSSGSIITDGVILGDLLGTTASSITQSGGTITVNGAVTINQPVANSVTNTWDINNQVVTVNGLITFAGSNTTASRVGRIGITNGSLFALGGITFVSGASACHVIDMSGGTGNLILNGALTVPANSATLSAGTTSNFIYGDSNAQTVNYFSSGAYNNLKIDNTNTSGATLSAAITASNVAGNLSIGSINSGSTFNNGGFAITLASTKNYTVSSGSTFNLAGTTSMVSVSGGGTKTFGATSITNYSGAAQTVTAETYGNLTLSGSGIKTMPASTITVAGNFATSGTTTVTAAGAINTTGNFTLAGTAFTAGSFTHAVGGNFVNTSGTVTTTGSTFNFNGTTQDVGGTNSTTFNNVTLSNSGTKTLSKAATISANLTIASSVIANLSTLTHTAGTLTLGSFGTPSGSWGSTTSSATNQNNIYFATTTGIINVTTPSCPAISAVLSGANTICSGGSTNLAVAITGGLSTYTVVYSGGTVNTYTSGTAISVSPSTTTGYSLTSVKDTNGCSATVSGTPTVTVNNAPTIASISAPSALCSGGSLNPTAPTVTANGSTVTSQGWQLETAVGSGTFATLTVPYTVAFADNGKKIRYIATNSCGTTNGNQVTLTINDVPTIASISAPSALCTGGSLNPTAPTVTANGSTVTSQGWQLETAVGSGTFATLTVPYTVAFADNGKKIRYTATNSCGTTNGNQVTLTINNAPTIASISAPSALCSGGSLNPTAPTVTANGSTLTSQGWQLETTVGSGTFATLTVPYTVAFADNGKKIRYIATNSCGTTNGNQVTLTINDVPTIASISAPSALCSGGSLNPTAPTVTANGSTVTSQGWQLETAVGSGTFATLTVPYTVAFADNGKKIRYTATNSCGTTNGNQVTLTVRPVFTSGAIGTTGETICYSGSPTLGINSITDASGGDGVITYKWQANGVDIPSSNSNTFDPPPGLTVTTTYTRFAKDNTCNTTFTVSTGSWVVTVRPVFTSGSINTTGETICTGGTPATTIGSATAASGGDNAITYSWRSSSDGYTAAISGATSATYLPPSGLTVTTSYRRYAKDGTCNTTPTVSTGTWTVTVTPSNTAGSASTTPTLCISTALTAITHTTTGATGIGTATGLPTGVTASWASNTITISGTPSASGTFNYSIPLTGGCGTVNATGTITVRAASTAAVITGTASICSGSSTKLQVAITGGTSPYTVVYTSGSVSSYTSGSYISVSPTSTTTYTITSVTDANGCIGTGNSGSAVVTLSSTSTSDGVTWSNGTPTGTKDAIFTGNATIGADLTACSLTVNNSAVVSVTSGFDVTLNGALTVSSGSFTLNNTANLIQNIPTGTSYTNSGNIIVKRNSSALKRLDYTLWSSPVTGQGLYAFSPFTLPNRFYVYNTATNLYSNSVGFSLTGLQYPSPLVSPNGVNGTDSNNVQFVNGKGYLIRVPWDHPTAATVWNGTFTGVPNNGDVTFAMATGYNAVGNPYPSRLNVSDFINGNPNITGPLYLWRKTNDNVTTSYGTLTKTAYVANGAAGGDTGTGYFNVGNEANWVLNIGQGFIVNATSNSNLTFTNSMRRSSNADQFFRAPQAIALANTGLYWLNLNADTGVYSQMAVGYSSEGTLAEDRGIDGKNINQEFYLTSLIGTDEYSIQGRPDFQDTDIVPLSYKVATAGTYSITIDHTAGLFTGGTQSIYLKDNLTNTINNLSAGAYAFTSAVGTFNNRFEIIYQSQLVTNHSIFTDSNVTVYAHNNELVINTGNIVMATVKVFDIRGRLLQEEKGINANHTTVNAGLANEVLLVQITSEDGITVIKKVVR